MVGCASCGNENPAEARFCSHCGAPLASETPVATVARKVVTVLFSDVSGFTALGERLDPESLQQLVGRWFHEAQRVIARHGGVVEKYMGDCVMAVFGVPVVHEDDALRAARAALEMRETLAELNRELERRWGVRLQVRTGVNTGEAVVGEAPGGEMSTVGDAVNVAQRLEAAAPDGEILIGAEPAGLVEAAARLEPVEPLTLKGKSEPVPAWRLVSIESELNGTPGRVRTPFVGRVDELERLRATFRQVASERRPQMVTVLGAPGIGKSSLAEALLADVRTEATTAVGHCLPYGDGITYWPVAEIVRRLAGDGTERAIAALAGDAAVQDAESIASRLARIAGFEAGAVPVEEAQWAVRKLLESVASRRPLVVVMEDIHWAEPTFIDLLQHLVELLVDVPLLILCLARQELLDEHPGWEAVGGRRASTIALDRLSADEAGRLLGRLARGSRLADEERAELLATAEGNPFFLQQMVAIRAEDPEAAAAVPPTIQAVLSARIDRLPSGEREVIERGSIEGRTFHRASVAELLAEEAEPRLDANLAALVRRELIRPGPPDFEGEEAFRFDHILIRDATYGLLPKRSRAELHERHARWLESRAERTSGEWAEIAGYHFEQAFRCRLEVEPAAEEAYRPLATHGGRRLGTAGSAALARDDLPAAINLLERATTLLPDDDAAHGGLGPKLGTALTEAGRLAEAERTLDEAIAQADHSGDAGARAHAEISRLSTRLQVDTEAGAAELRARFEQLLDAFERSGDELGLGQLWRLRALVHWIEARSTEADAAWERAAEHARQADDERTWADSLTWLASSAHIGPTPVDDGIARCEDIHAQLGEHRRLQALVLHPLAALRAMREEFAAAKELLAESNAILAELGVTMHTAVSHHEAYVAHASGDPAEAEAVLRRGYERLEGMGEKALLATTAAMLADVVEQRGRPDEAWALTQAAEEEAAEDDLSAQVLWRSVRARVLARRGKHAAAKLLSAEAVNLAARTDWLSERADAERSQAQVLAAAEEPAAASAALGRAVELYTRKGDVAGTRRGRSRRNIKVSL